jgi:hypothetical protein
MQIEPPKILRALRGDSEAKAEALETYPSRQLDNAVFARLGAPPQADDRQ